MSGGSGERPTGPHSKAEQALIATGLPFALQVARRLARRTTVLSQQDLEGCAALAVTELARGFDAGRGSWKGYVTTRVGFALSSALRKEQRASLLDAEQAITAGLAHHEGLPPCDSALAGTDEEAYARLVEITSEAADVLAMFLAPPDERASLVGAALAELAPFARRVMELHYLEAKTFRQVAAELDSTLSKVYQTHQRALPKLRSKLRARGLP